MGAESKIEWTDHTFNGWWGCVKVSPACDFCYAEKFAHRYFQNLWGKGSGRRFFGEKHWNEPLKWNRDAAKEGKRKKVFCGSMMDIMESRQDLNEPRERIYILTGETPWLNWLFLTKRPNQYLNKLPKAWMNHPRNNVWLGTTVESDKYLFRIDQLKSVPAVVHFLSIEPLIEEIHLTEEHLDGIEWVIVGGESGSKEARPMNPEWVRKIRDLCIKCGVDFFFKQWGNWHPVEDVEFHTDMEAEFLDDGFNAGKGQNGQDYFDKANRKDLNVHWWDDDSCFSIYLANKHESARMLDGREWSQFPLTIDRRKLHSVYDMDP